ncbi:MAG: hypothetical protein QME96_15055, partial [Myxococcota bacterium]|nr:hypothetical protein [Myxococcota bacterium]
MKRRGSAGWNGMEKRALIVALVVSLLAHHTTISFLSPPRPPTARRAPIELVTVEMEEAGPAAERAVEGAGVPLAAAEPPAEATATYEAPQDPAPRRERERQQPPRVARAEP